MNGYEAGKRRGKKWDTCQPEGAVQAGLRLKEYCATCGRNLANADGGLSFPGNMGELELCLKCAAELYAMLSQAFDVGMLH